ncbi:TonB-dependent receptor [Zhouia amylolytica]|uniref:TonB-dependent receptor plug n=1 Tax=Zhouia amylolytica AD3 TaxID=1286632 RepID=W2USH3_9FLAO|nr:TonB-dependent receptor [Zhouia amylolytica]ETN96431.1 tonB-dependent receptor plug [Zhouia amylolytica AD3]
MKLTFVLLTVSLFQIQAGNIDQKRLSLSFKNQSLGVVFNEIERQTEYNFFYDSEEIDLKKKISLNFSEKTIKEIVAVLLNDINLSYRFIDKQIIVYRRTSESKGKIKGDSRQEQESILKGKVLNENGVPLPGATILEKGTTNGVSSDFNGGFLLKTTSKNVIITVTYVGYQKKEVEANVGSVVTIQMEPALSDLDEVVLVGYGKVNKEDVTGSVGSVEMKNIQNLAPTVNLDNALQGQVSGLYVSSSNGQPGAASKVRIRGTTSLFGSNQPLYVIDGIPVVPNGNIPPAGSSAGGRLGDELNNQGLSTPIGNISLDNIESVSVLKDASAAAIYGSRAANGVIIITTKQGSFETKPSFEFNTSLSLQTPNTLDVLNASQFREAWVTAVQNSEVNNSFTQSVLDGSYFGNADTNWEDEVSPGSPSSVNYYFAVYGGSENTRYNTSLSLLNQEGTYNSSKFDRYVYNLNIDTKFSDRLRFGSKVNLSFSDQSSPDGGLTQLTYRFRPDLPVFNEDGDYSTSSTYFSDNPVARSKATNNNETFLVLASLFAEYEILNGLKYKPLIALNYNNGNQNSYYPGFTFRGGWFPFSGIGDGYAQESTSNFTKTLFENTLSYQKTFNGKHHLNAVAGASFEKNLNKSLKSWGEGFPNDVLTNITNATVYTDGSSYKINSGLVSYFSRVNYDFRNKYLLTLSGRIDGSSKFATDNKYAFFPAAAIAWRVSSEEFLGDSNIISDLKLRASAGKTGQQDFGPYAWRTLFSNEDYGKDPAIVMDQLGNDQLKWETTNQFDVGIDFTLFDGAFSGTLGYYLKETNDALFSTITPGSTGFNRTIANIADTKNEGLELEFKADIINTNDFNWNMSFNITRNKNELTRINDDFKDENGFLTGFSGGGYLKEGSPIGLIYGYVSEGIFQSQQTIEGLNSSSPTGYYQDEYTSPGDIRFRDINGPEGVPDGVITNLDRKVIGDSQPEFFGGFSNTFRYKGFSLSAFFNYSFGNDLHAFVLGQDTNFSSTYVGENKTTAVLNAWTEQNTSSDIPRIVYTDPNDNDRISSHYLYDASFIRLRTLNLSYSLSPKVLNKIGFIDHITLYCSGQNLFTITDYPGADPEATNLFNNDLSSGRDINRFPISKVFTTGIRVKF